MSASERRTKGRQKVALVRMEKQSNRLVTFSKRRAGLFKKASELCTLSDAQAVIVVFSPGRKAFSFGHPSVDDIIDCFLSGGSCPNKGGQQVEQLEKESLSRMNVELTALNTRVESVKKRCEELLKERKAKGSPGLWWLAPNDDLRLSPAHLRELLSPMTKLRDKVCQLSQRYIRDGTDMKSVSFMAPNPVNPSGYPFPLNMARGGGQTSFGGQPSILMVPNPIERNPNEHPPMVMIPTPMVGFDPSLPMGSSGLGLAPANPLLPMPNHIGGFNAPNMPPFQGGPNMPPFRGANNPIGGQVDGAPMAVPFNRDMMDPTKMPPNFESYTSLLMGSSPTDAPNTKGGYGFGPGFY